MSTFRKNINCVTSTFTMSLRQSWRSVAILSRNHNCLRQSVRFRKAIDPSVTERYLDPEIHSTKSSMMNLISLQESDLMFVTKYSPLGFELQNGVKLAGPTVFFPRNCLKWKVTRASDINEKSLGLFTLLSPKLDLLIIGTGSRPYSLPQEVVSFLRSKRINFEVYTSDHAIATFNFQNNDQRWVAAAIIPPERQKADLHDYVEGKYKDIMDSTSLPLQEEIELRKLELADVRSAKKLVGDIKLDSADMKRTVSPLGTSQSFLSSSLDGVNRNKEEKDIAGELTEKKVENKENNSEVKSENEKAKK